MKTSWLLLFANVLNVTLDNPPAWAQMVRNAEPGERVHAYIAALDALSRECQAEMRRLQELVQEK